jgi:hypothetical protein
MEGMARRVRITVFLDDQEYEILQACVPRGMTPSQTLRAAALDKLTWSYEHSKRYKPLTENQWQQRVNQDLQGPPSVYPVPPTRGAKPHESAAADVQQNDGPTFVPEEQQ